MPPAVIFTNVSRHYGPVKAVDNISFQVEDGEFFAMLGPSGSGKTTCLRLIAGFETPTSGDILLSGVPAGKLPPYDRNVNTVFQDYALFPHMNVLDNVCYGLMVKGVGKKERVRRAEEMLELVKLPGMGQRKPGQLSGGQRQRVALARALINRPSVLLLDEPLGALDLKLRKEMQVELKALQQTLGITFIFVTHDQDEALSMSDRLAVFSDGRIEQIGVPDEVYERPATRFVAEFVGEANIIEKPEAQLLLGLDHAFTIRPEKISMIEDEEPLANCRMVTGQVQAMQYFGAGTSYTVLVAPDITFHVFSRNARSGLSAAVSRKLSVGSPVRLCWHLDDMQPLKDEGGRS